MTRSTDSRRARNSASLTIGARRRPASRPSRRRCFLASRRVEPGDRGDLVLGGAGLADPGDGVGLGVVGAQPSSPARRRRRRRREVPSPVPSVASESSSADAGPAEASVASSAVSAEPDSVARPRSSPSPDLRRRRPPRRRRRRPPPSPSPSVSSADSEESASVSVVGAGLGALGVLGGRSASARAAAASSSSSATGASSAAAAFLPDRFRAGRSAAAFFAADFFAADFFAGAAASVSSVASRRRWRLGGLRGVGRLDRGGRGLLARTAGGRRATGAWNSTAWPVAASGPQRSRLPRRSRRRPRPRSGAAAAFLAVRLAAVFLAGALAAATCGRPPSWPGRAPRRPGRPRPARRQRRARGSRRSSSRRSAWRRLLGGRPAGGGLLHDRGVGVAGSGRRRRVGGRSRRPRRTRRRGGLLGGRLARPTGHDGRAARRPRWAGPAPLGALGLVVLVITEHVVLLGHRGGADTASARSRRTIPGTQSFSGGDPLRVCVSGAGRHLPRSPGP